MKPNITLVDLKTMEPKTIFDSGFEPQLGYWVAVRGNIHDWAVYASRAWSNDIAEHGGKVWKPHALRLVSVDEEAAWWYRE